MASRRFRADFGKAVADLCSTLARMGATARIDFGGNIWEYEAEILRRSGLEYNVNQPGLGLNGVRITFWRNDRGYAYEAVEFAPEDDNLRACQRTITALYQCFEDYKVRRVGVDNFDALFGGFLLLGDGRREWWEILGVPQDATKRQILKAFRAKAITEHPDRGGSEERFALVQSAYDQAMDSLGR